VLLPQVPVEQGWDQDEYLDYINRKAGLPPGSWDDPSAERYVFTAVVFGEED
jgi:AMMECR1 domain-containing protein